MSSEGSSRGRRHYGIAEIADALGVDRQLVTVWRRRLSRGLPPPDDELASGPLWVAATIEPWIAATRARLARERTGAGPEPALTPAFTRRAVRRFLRLVALLLEEPRRPRPLLQAAMALAELRPRLEQAANELPDDAGVAALLEVLVALDRATPALTAEPTAEPVEDLLTASTAALPRLPALLSG